MYAMVLKLGSKVPEGFYYIKDDFSYDFDHMDLYFSKNTNC